MNELNGYNDFIGEVKNRIRSAQYKALKSVNKELVGLYWDIGRLIVRKQKVIGWGKSVVEMLAKDLQKEFPSQIGFSSRNLWLMVKFYTEYQSYKNLQPLVAEIGWTHNIMIISKCQDRLELGGDFTYIGNQYRILAGSEEYYIDLLLFHRRLQCFVVIELKTGRFKPEYKGKMEFYLNVLNDQYKHPYENDAIGIIICKSKNRLVVEYSLKNSVSQIGVASYSTSPALPNYYQEILPSPEKMENSIKRWLNQ